MSEASFNELLGILYMNEELNTSSRFKSLMGTKICLKKKKKRKKIEIVACPHKLTLVLPWISLSYQNVEILMIGSWLVSLSTLLGVYGMVFEDALSGKVTWHGSSSTSFRTRRGAFNKAQLSCKRHTLRARHKANKKCT